MRLTALLEQRYDRTPDGLIWTPGPHDYSFWERYLSVFSDVRVVARVRDVPSPTTSALPAGGTRVSFVCVPHYIGPSQYLQVQHKVKRVVHRAVLDPQAGAVLLRVPGNLSNIAFQVLRGRPYAVEAVGDPYDLYAPGVSHHPLRAVFQYQNTRQMKAQCREASVIGYVTREALQRRYPTHGQAFGISDVNLPPEAYAAAGRRWHPAPYEAVMVCTLQTQAAYKGVDVALAALRQVRQQGLDLRLRIVGEGALRSIYEAQAQTLGIAAHVQFIGAVPSGAGVRTQLDQADVFLMPSRQEGLPRAMVEAMARGLPALGTEIGGIPELLDLPERFAPGDSSAVALGLLTLLQDSVRYEAQAERNLRISQEYSNETLGKLRLKFYQAMRTMGDPAGRLTS